MDKPFGEWNSFKIRMIGERVTIVFNGETVVDNAVLENFFANKKAGYIAYAKPGAPADAKKEEKLPNGWIKDPAFAKDPDARLLFFSSRHPSFDQRLNLMPIYRVDLSPHAN